MYLKIIMMVLIILVIIVGAVLLLTPHQTEGDCVVIPKLELKEEISHLADEAEEKGVYMSSHSFDPAEGDMILYGHRTRGNAPFCDLNLLIRGDKVKVYYNGSCYDYVVQDKIIKNDIVINTTVNHGGNKLYLITCHPPGSCKGRLVVECIKK